MLRLNWLLVTSSMGAPVPYSEPSHNGAGGARDAHRTGPQCPRSLYGASGESVTVTSVHFAELPFVLHAPELKTLIEADDAHSEPRRRPLLSGLVVPEKVNKVTEAGHDVLPPVIRRWKPHRQYRRGGPYLLDRVRRNGQLDGGAGLTADRLHLYRLAENPRYEQAIPGTPGVAGLTVDAKHVLADPLRSEPPEADDIASLIAEHTGLRRYNRLDSRRGESGALTEHGHRDRATRCEGLVAMNGKCCRLDQLARLCGDRLHAQQPTTVSLGDHLDEAARVEIDECARHIVERARATVSFDAFHMCFSFRQAHRGDLRIREHHRGHAAQVQRHVAAGHVLGRARAASRRDE